MFFTVVLYIGLAANDKSSSGVQIYQLLRGFGIWLWFWIQFEQKYWQMDGFGELEKKALIGGFAYPYSPRSHRVSLC